MSEQERAEMPMPADIKAIAAMIRADTDSSRGHVNDGFLRDQDYVRVKKIFRRYLDRFDRFDPPAEDDRG